MSEHHEHDDRGRLLRGARPDRRVRGRRGHLRRAGGRRARLAARQAGRAGDHHLGAVVDADDDLAGLAHDALDGPPGRVPQGVRRGAPALPHAARVDDRDRRRSGGLVRRAVPAVGELRLRLVDGAVADDRLLLRAHRHRLRRLLPPRADEVGQELLLHRGRAADRGGRPRIPVRQGDPRVLEDRPELLGQLAVRHRDPGRARARAAVAGRRAVDRLAPRRHEEFFGRKTEIVDPDVAAGRRLGVAAVPEEAV
jgi:hypothetical protein